MVMKGYGKKGWLVSLLIGVMICLCSCGTSSNSSVESSNTDSGNTTANSSSSINDNKTESKTASKDDSVIEIPEDYFLTQVNDIYTNAEDYLGRTLKYQGIFEKSTYGEGDNQEQIMYVFRNSPGCCGNDGTAGFEVLWDGDMPKQESWVEVEGVLQSYEDADGNKFLQLKVDSLNVLKECGKEFVSQ